MTKNLQKLEVVKGFSDDIQMEFGVEKCAEASFIGGKLYRNQNITLNENTTNRVTRTSWSLQASGRWRTWRNTKKLKTELSCKNKFLAMTSLAVLVVQYSFRILKWTNADIRKVERKTRKLFALHSALYPKLDADRLYISRKGGGRGLLNIAARISTSIRGIANYIK